MILTASQLRTLKNVCEANPARPFRCHLEYKPARKLARFGLVTLVDVFPYSMSVKPTERGREELANHP